MKKTNGFIATVLAMVLWGCVGDQQTTKSSPASIVLDLAGQDDTAVLLPFDRQTGGPEMHVVYEKAPLGSSEIRNADGPYETPHD